MSSNSPHAIRYDLLQKDLDQQADLAEKEQLIIYELPYSWEVHYERMVDRKTWISKIEYNGFAYYHDNVQFELEKAGLPRGECEDRVIGVIGRSKPTSRRDAKIASWLRGLIGPTEARWSKHFDKGHFVAHSLGGGTELNIFPQRRDLNRGWSEAGREFREMERYCLRNPGTLLFHRPIYLAEGFQPDALDFGLLKTDGELWVRRFNNIPPPSI